MNDSLKYDRTSRLPEASSMVSSEFEFNDPKKLDELPAAKCGLKRAV